MKRLLIVTDTWHPQLNGIVRVTQELTTRLERRGFEVLLVDSSLFFSVPLPIYPELSVALFPGRQLRRIVDDFKPDYVHIMTEGALGLAARRLCRRRGWRFTTTYHTHLQLYVHVRYHRFLGLVYRLLRWFHGGAERTMVSTLSLKQALEENGFKNLALCPLGVDAERFVRNLAAKGAYPGPVFMYLGRLAPEKSPEEFLKLDLPGTKVVVGDGPSRHHLERRYGDRAMFVGYKRGQELIDALSAADVLVFPSRTETFGLVVLEALACGVPVVAHNVMGPRDIITTGVDGYLTDDLKEGALKALTLERAKCREKSLQFSWERATEAFEQQLALIK